MTDRPEVASGSPRWRARNRRSSEGRAPSPSECRRRRARGRPPSRTRRKRRRTFSRGKRWSPPRAAPWPRARAAAAHRTHAADGLVETQATKAWSSPAATSGLSGDASSISRRRRKTPATNRPPAACTTAARSARRCQARRFAWCQHERNRHHPHHVVVDRPPRRPARGCAAQAARASFRRARRCAPANAAVRRDARERHCLALAGEANWPGGAEQRGLGIVHERRSANALDDVQSSDRPAGDRGVRAKASLSPRIAVTPPLGPIGAKRAGLAEDDRAVWLGGQGPRALADHDDSAGSGSPRSCSRSCRS